MRYEHLEWDLSTAACAELEALVREGLKLRKTELVEAELTLCANQLRARLQRTDVDPHCPKNSASEDWLS